MRDTAVPTVGRVNADQGAREAWRSAVEWGAAAARLSIRIEREMDKLLAVRREAQAKERRVVYLARRDRERVEREVEQRAQAFMERLTGGSENPR